MFPFKSDLKRMSTIAYYSDGKEIQEYRILCKGAPETIKSLLTEIPNFYD